MPKKLYEYENPGHIAFNSIILFFILFIYLTKLGPNFTGAWANWVKWIWPILVKTCSALAELLEGLCLYLDWENLYMENLLIPKNNIIPQCSFVFEHLGIQLKGKAAREFQNSPVVRLDTF